MEKTVAVIIPCFNYAHYLDECIQSVLVQTHPVNEILVVDDGGSDNAKEVCERFIPRNYIPASDLGTEDLKPAPKIVYFRKENGGLSSARNYGIARMKSSHYMTLDADDKLVPGAIEEHVRLLKDDKSCAQCALMEFGERHVVNVPPATTSLERVMQANTMYCNTMFPKKAWEEVGGYDESETMRLGYEDWEFNIRVLAAGYKVYTSDFIALRYRVHEGQMTQATAHPKRQLLYKYIYEKHKDLYEKLNLKVAGYK